MKSRITKTVALAAMMAAGATAAHATEGWYGRADVGYSTDGSVDLGADDLDLDNDWTQHLGLGYALQNNFRLEGELGHRFNNFGTGVLDDGDVHVWSGMLNGFYDFNRGGRIEPYIGAGIGAARLNLSAVAGPISVHDDDTVLAYQAMVGLAIGITERLDLDIGYRYFVADGGEFDGVFDSEGGDTAITVDGDYEQQAVTVGLRWQFQGAEPPPPPVVVPPPPVQPPPPPPPVACPTSEFVVYFEWDRSNLNQAALETIDAAVARARQCNISGVVVVGHTDTSGSPTYNQGLSERRASVVRDALVARGIATGSVQTQARGETDLARATRDGVREPLNRRSAVTISFR
jgi:OOP family OmpA-OmpF porin